MELKKLMRLYIRQELSHFTAFRTWLFVFVWPKISCQYDYQCDFSFKKDHMAQWCETFWYGLILTSCIMCLDVEHMRLQIWQPLLFVLHICLTKIMPVISMWFKLQEEPHETECQPDISTIQSFLWLVVQLLMPQISWELWFFMILWKCSHVHVHVPHKNHSSYLNSQCDLSFKRNHKEQY